MEPELEWFAANDASLGVIHRTDIKVHVLYVVEQSQLKLTLKQTPRKVKRTKTNKACEAQRTALVLRV